MVQKPPAQEFLKLQAQEFLKLQALTFLKLPVPEFLKNTHREQLLKLPNSTPLQLV